MNRDVTYCTGDNCKLRELCVRFSNINPKTLYYFDKPPYTENGYKQSCDFYKRKNEL